MEDGTAAAELAWDPDGYEAALGILWTGLAPSMPHKLREDLNYARRTFLVEPLKPGSTTTTVFSNLRPDINVVSVKVMYGGVGNAIGKALVTIASADDSKSPDIRAGKGDLTNQHF